MAGRQTIFLAAVGASLACLALSVIAAESGAALIPLFSTRLPGATLRPWSVQSVRTSPSGTKYTLIRDDELGVTVLEGSAAAAAGALAYRFDGDVKATPLLKFKWRPGGLIVGSDPQTRVGDDYVARVSVTFATEPDRAGMTEKTENAVAKALYGETPPHAALTYVFTHKAALSSIITSPYTRRVKLIVVDADPASVGKWKDFTRDVYADYKRAFGEEPTRISGVVIMVDTDNTGETTSARFGDISLSPRQ